MFEDILRNVRRRRPLVHCITNYVTANDCANALLACGASPIMADDEAEAAEITALADALTINIGTLNRRTVSSMLLSCKEAARRGIPTVFDPVGAGASRLRTETAQKLLQAAPFSVIRGNISEILSLSGEAGRTQGVDADQSQLVRPEDTDGAIAFAKALSCKTGAVIAITGAIDIVSDKNTAYVIKNGCKQMSLITGTGCMLSAITAGFCGANPDNILKAAAAAVCAMGLCGETAWEKASSRMEGPGSMRAYLIDALYKLTPEILSGGMKIESR